MIFDFLLSMKILLLSDYVKFEIGGHTENPKNKVSGQFLIQLYFKMNWGYASGSQVSEKPAIRDTSPSRSLDLLGATLSFEQP